MLEDTADEVKQGLKVLPFQKDEETVLRGNINIWFNRIQGKSELQK